MIAPLNNFATLERQAARMLHDEGKREADSISVERVRFILLRPMERQPLGSVFIDPIAELVRLFRVAYIGGLPAGPTEPYVHLDARQVPILNADHPLQVVDVPVYVDAVRSSGIIAYHNKGGIQLYARMPRESGQSLRPTLLFLSMVQEMVAAHNCLPVDRLVVDVDILASTPQWMADVMSIDKWVDFYDPTSLTPVSVTPLVPSGPCIGWANEVDLTRREGAVVMYISTIRHILLPATRAMKELEDEERPLLDRLQSAMAHINRMKASDWKAACIEWLRCMGEQANGIHPTSAV